MKIQSLTKAELLELRDKLIKRLAALADRIGLIDRRLDVIRSNELEEAIMSAEPIREEA